MIVCAGVVTQTCYGVQATESACSRRNEPALRMRLGLADGPRGVRLLERRILKSPS